MRNNSMNDKLPKELVWVEGRAHLQLWTLQETLGTGGPGILTFHTTQVQAQPMIHQNQALAQTSNQKI